MLFRLMAFAGITALTAITLSSSPSAAPQAPRQATPSAERGDAGASPASSQRALLDRYCVSCHNDRLKSGGLALAGLDLTRVPEHAEQFEKVIRKLRAGLMPPPGRPRPEPAAYQALIAYLESEIDRAAQANPNPGRTDTVHRLNRTEYQNAIRDVLDLTIDAAEYLPTDDSTGGFDNVASALKMSPTLMERYLSAAEKISRLAVGGTPLPTEVVFEVKPETQQDRRVEGSPFGTRGGAVYHYTFPVDAEYEFFVKLEGSSSEPQTLELAVDGVIVKTFTGLLKGQNRDEYEAAGDKLGMRASIKAGPRAIGLWFVESPSAVQYATTMRKPYERGVVSQTGLFSPSLLSLRSVMLRGPHAVTGAGDTPSRRRIFVCRPASAAQEPSCARTILSQLASRAYRRTVTDADVQVLLTAYQSESATGGFDAGIQGAIWQMLMSPNFLFRVERDPAAAAKSPVIAAQGTPAVYRISDLEMASRLSFFLWSSVPDEELLTVARSGKLRHQAVLRQQVRRMLADDRAARLMENFVGQWLYLRNLPDLGRPIEVFPHFDETLRDAFIEETRLFFDAIRREDRSVLDVLRADYTFVNERLARHYGIPHVQGSHFRKVTFADDKRRGILGQGALLAVTSQPNRTSPVVRGKWIMENILGSAPPPPPPNVPPLRDQEGAGEKAKSMRERMAQHRNNPTCAACHNTLDPLGFALENFDAVGKWRDIDAGFERIDASGAMPSGEKFASLTEFRAMLLRQPDTFVLAFTERLLTYALGRVVFYYDMPAVRKIVRDSARDEFRFSSLVQAVVESAPFQMRRAGE